jgi:hypothetical protein
MNVVIICLSIVVVLIGVIFLVRNFYIAFNLRKTRIRKLMFIDPIVQQLASGRVVSSLQILSIAEDPSLRLMLFRALELLNCLHLFPSDFYSEEKGAETYMVNWLEYPTELNAKPDEIQLMNIITLGENQDIRYYVFKFRIHTLRWAAKLDWMVGVCGPYDQQSLPFDPPRRVFSRFRSSTSTSPQEEAAWVHQHINP